MKLWKHLKEAIKAGCHDGLAAALETVLRQSSIEGCVASFEDLRVKLRLPSFGTIPTPLCRKGETAELPVSDWALEFGRTAKIAGVNQLVGHVHHCANGEWWWFVGHNQLFPLKVGTAKSLREGIRCVDGMLLKHWPTEGAPPATKATKRPKARK